MGAQRKAWYGRHPETRRDQRLHHHQVVGREPDPRLVALGGAQRNQVATATSTWCVVGVVQGVEHEELYDGDLRLIGRSDNHVGEVSGFAPPGDIHRVHNTSDSTAISVHIYGTDVTRIGSSVRRYYD